MAESDEAGFTLVEMIVSLAVTALIALLLIQSLQATGLITRNAKRLAAQEEVQLVRGHLRRTLASVVRRRQDGSRIPFLGQDGQLMAIVGANREAERDTELQFGLSTVVTPDGSGLVLIENTRASNGAEVAPPDVLLDGVAGLRLRYFGLRVRAGRLIGSRAGSRPGSERTSFRPSSRSRSCSRPPIRGDGPP
ncbi:type II secretion system protein J [Methylobacterium komagatae]|uniref:Type II secretion system protein J n=1 Tax=Methylobacterium komagatae TaxID=374425 RepID=A0ABW2BI21_9HYPH